MKFLSLFPYYIAWHYSSAFVNFFSIWGNFIWFTYNYFSILILLKTLFSPFRRLGEKYKGGLDIGNWFESIILNTVMRVVGLILRSIIIIVGVTTLFIVFLAGIVTFFVWLVLPITLIFFIVVGLIALFQ